MKNPSRHPRQSRRVWLTRTGALAAGCIVSREITASPSHDSLSMVDLTEKPSGWIDAHVHVWPSFGTEYPLADDFAEKDVRPLSFTPTELLAHCAPANVTRIVLIQMNFFGFDNRYMLDCIARYPGVFAGVAVVDHNDADVALEMRDLRTQGVRGYRLYANASNASQWKRSSGIHHMFECGAETGQAMCMLSDPEALPAIDALMEQHPKTTVVIDHFSRIGMNGDVNTRALETLCEMAERKNLYVKTSAFYALGEKKPPYDDLAPMILKLRDAFGAERLMWASDCPYQVQAPHHYAASIALIRDRLDFLSESERTELLRGTAERVFFSP